MSHPTPHDVVVYSTPFCAPCEKLKGYLRAHGIEFAVKDLMMDEEAAELMDSLGIRSAPALQVDGQVYAGPQLSAEKIDELLGL